MKITLALTIARRIRAWATRQKKAKNLRLNKSNSVMFISRNNGTSIFKFLN